MGRMAVSSPVSAVLVVVARSRVPGLRTTGAEVAVAAGGFVAVGWR